MHRVASCFLSVLLFIGIPSNAQNILNNGGFESGLMCYSEWMWSNTGRDFAGDYSFSLSTDAHSGTYSLEISCGGSDCLKAAIISDYIPASPGQSYRMSLYAKCPAGGVADVYIPWTSTGGTTAFLKCDGNWDLNQFTFQTGSAPGKLFYYIFDRGSRFLRVDDVALTFGNGTAPAYTPLHPGVRHTSISGQNVYVDGAPYLSLGFYGVLYGDLSQVAATGANTIVGAVDSSADCYNTGQKSYLDTAYELGLNFLPESTTTARLRSPAVFPTVTQTFAPHLANIAWYLADEPDLSSIRWLYVPPATFVAESQAAKQKTTLPVTADFQMAAYGTVGNLSGYNGAADIWWAEPYGTNFSTLTHAVQLFNAIQRRPIWLAQNDIDASLIVPKAYWAVVNGVTGIHYFNWDAIKAEPLKLAAVEQVFSELKSLKNAIFGPALDKLVTPPPGITSMSRFDSGSGTSYILAVNPVAQTIHGNFLVQELKAGQTITVVNENRSITAGAGQFSDSFPGVARHVYAIHTTQTGLTGSIASQTGPANARDWKIQVYNTGIGVAKTAQISSLTLAQTGGPACSPVVAPGTLPVHLGDLAPAQSATGNVIINFGGCGSTATFTVRLGLSANSGATVATITRNNERM